MKRIALFSGLALLLGLASCVKDANLGNNPDTGKNPAGTGKRSTIRASYAGAETRVALDSLSVTWTAGDSVYLYIDTLATNNSNAGSNIAKLSKYLSIYRLLSGAGEQSATFEGTSASFTIDTTTNAMRVFFAAYPAYKGTIPANSLAGTATGVDSASLANGNGNCTYDLHRRQVQTGVSDPEGLGKYLLMWADPIKDRYEVDKENLNFHFRHVCAVLGFNLKNIPDNVTVDSVTVQEYDPSTGRAVTDKVAYKNCFMLRTQLSRKSTGGDWWYGNVSSLNYYVNSMTVAMGTPIKGSENKEFTAKISVIPHDYMTDARSSQATTNQGLGSAAARYIRVVVNVIKGGVYDTYTFAKVDAEDNPVPTCTYWEPGQYYTRDIDFLDKQSDLDLAEPPPSLPDFVQVPDVYVADSTALRWVATEVATNTYGLNGFAGCTVHLTDDIDLNGAKWLPIGTTATPFKGNFDGGKKTVSNMKVVNARSSFLGPMTGVSGTPLEVYDLNFSDATILPTNNNPSAVITDIASYVNITNCTVDGLTLARDASFPAGTNLASQGGLVANFGNGKIENCTVTNADLQTLPTAQNNNNIGGLVAQVTGSDVTIKGCSFSGSLLGYNNIAGIVANVNQNQSNILIDSCTVSGSGTIKGCIGVAGIVAIVNTNVTGMVIQKCKVTGSMTISATTVAGSAYGGGGIAGRLSAPARIDQCKVTGATIEGNDQINWNTSPTAGNAGGIVGTVDGSNTKTNAAGGVGTVVSNCAVTDCTVRSIRDSNNACPVGGIVGYATGTQILHCTSQNTTVTAIGYSAGYANANMSGLGGICGYIANDTLTTVRSVIFACKNIGTGTVTYDSSISGYNVGWKIGGILGSNRAPNTYIGSCYNEVPLSNHGTANVANAFLGGICGWSDASPIATITIEGCYSIGAITSNTIATQPVVALGRMAGITGIAANTTMVNCFYNTMYGNAAAQGSSKAFSATAWPDLTNSSTNPVTDYTAGWSVSGTALPSVIPTWSSLTDINCPWDDLGDAATPTYPTLK